MSADKTENTLRPLSTATCTCHASENPRAGQKMKKNWLVARGPTRLLRPGGSKINERINGRKLVRNSSAFVGVKTFAFLRGILNATPRLGIVLRSERLTRLDSVAGRKETEPLKRWRSEEASTVFAWKNG